MGNGKGLTFGLDIETTNPCSEIVLSSSLTAKDIEDAALASVQNYSRPTHIIYSTTFEMKHILRWRRMMFRDSTPAQSAIKMLYAAENFGLITSDQADEGAELFSARIHCRHMKKQRKERGKTKKRYTRVRSNYIGKRP